MPGDHIITVQHISPELKTRAEELRRLMTPHERKLWQRLRANRLGGFHFRRQQVIAGYIVDFYCHAVGLVVEVDGEIHLEQVTYDQERDAGLCALGLKVLHLSNTEIESQMDTVLTAILNSCHSIAGCLFFVSSLR